MSNLNAELDRVRVAEIGRHSELLAAGGTYAGLMESQVIPVG